MQASPISPSTYRQEIQDYIRSCERLLSSTALTPHASPLSLDERQVVEYYLEELKTHLLACQKF